MNALIHEIIRKLNGVDLSHALGYSDIEIEKMESFYNIKIAGHLRDFLSCIGRSSGNIVFRDLIFYTGYYAHKKPLTVSGHVVEQLYFRDDILKFGRPYCTGRPFLFAIECETQYYFLRTCADEPLQGISPNDDYSQLSNNPEIVYHFDENKGMVCNTGITFREYLLTRASVAFTDKIGMGEMIQI